MFDKGWSKDGEGHRIDFRKGVILLISNVDTEFMASLRTPI